MDKTISHLLEKVSYKEAEEKNESAETETETSESSTE
jgi:hypothetical protein